MNDQVYFKAQHLYHSHSCIDKINLPITASTTIDTTSLKATTYNIDEIESLPSPLPLKRENKQQLNISKLQEKLEENKDQDVFYYEGI